MAAFRALLTICFAYLLCDTTSSQDSVHYSIAEGLPVGTRVGELIPDAGLDDRYDAEELDSLGFRFLSGTDSSDDSVYMVIDAISGIITTGAVIDRDALCNGQITCVKQQDAAVVNPTEGLKVITVYLTIDDVNDNPPTFSQDVYYLEIAESASPGATYNLPLANDPDSAVFSVQEYRLENWLEMFQLDVFRLNDVPTTVQLSLIKQLDREVLDFYELSIIATDGGQPPREGHLTVNITVGDANDHGPVFLNSSYKVTLPENTAIQSTILKVSADDLDTGINGEVIYDFSSSTDPQYLDIFAIRPTTGFIYLKGSLDFESTPSYHLTVEARDSGVNSQPGYASVVVDVTDTNDNPPRITVNTLAGDGQAEIEENEAAGKFVAHISARDPDSGNGGLFDCTVTDSYFRLNKLQQSSYEILTAASFDREETARYNVRVLCQDYGVPSLSSFADIPIIIVDTNDNPPIFSRTTYFMALEENNQLLTDLITVNATDADIGTNARISYSVEDSARNLFTVNRETGLVRTNSVFDYEQTREVTVRMLATDGGTPALTGTTTLILVVSDTNDEKPEFSQSIYSFSVKENQPIGLEIGFVMATDADSAIYNQIEYSFADPTNDFTIDPTTGHIRTRAYLNREEHPIYNLTILATNAGMVPPHSGSATVQVTLLDENDNEPMFEFPDQRNNTLRISNRVPIGSQIGRILAYDLDVGENGRITYHISGGNEGVSFAVDADTGMITSLVSLSAYDFKLFEIMITIQDHGEPQKSSNRLLLINVDHTIPYTIPPSLISGTNVTIVIALAICSAIIVITLLVAIALLKVRDRRRKTQRELIYRCHVEASVPADGGDHRKMNGDGGPDCNGGLNPDDEKGPMYISRGVIVCDPASTQIHEQYECKPGNEPVLSGVPPSAAPAIPSKRGLDQSGMTNGGGGGGQKPWTLSVNNLQRNGGRGRGSNKDHDSDSAYSGDMSNSDSGRGPSLEEADLQAIQNKRNNLSWADQRYAQDPRKHPLEDPYQRPPSRNRPESRGPPDARIYPESRDQGTPRRQLDSSQPCNVYGNVDNNNRPLSVRGRPDTRPRVLNKPRFPSPPREPASRPRDAPTRDPRTNYHVKNNLNHPPHQQRHHPLYNPPRSRDADQGRRVQLEHGDKLSTAVTV